MCKMLQLVGKFTGFFLPQKEHSNISLAIFIVAEQLSSELSFIT
jgi:hypothetical protein